LGQPAVRVVHKEEARMKTRPLETAEAVLQVYRSQASDRASAMPQVGGGRRCRQCRERTAGRVCRASSGEGLLEVPLLAQVKDQKLTIPKLMHVVIHMVTHKPSLQETNSPSPPKKSKTTERPNGPTSSSRSSPLFTRSPLPIHLICRRLKRRIGWWRRGKSSGR
jgi:hypothetical protein